MEINSQNKRILIFSDPHQDWRHLDILLSRENYDIAVCLGDWFDSFYQDTYTDVEKTCAILKKQMRKNNFFSCFGNHDLPYFYDNPNAICSGYSKGKDKLICSLLGWDLAEIRDKFLWYIWVDDFLCTHAGLCAEHIHPKLNILNKNNLTQWLDLEIEQTKIKLKSNDNYWTYRAGYARGGEQPYGGLTWADWDDEFFPINGLNQIVGHTFRKNFKIQEVSGNYCIDTNLSQYLIISNGKIEIKNYADL